MKVIGTLQELMNLFLDPDTSFNSERIQMYTAVKAVQSVSLQVCEVRT